MITDRAVVRWKKLGVWGSFLGDILSNPEEGWLCFFKDVWLPVQTLIPASSSPCSLPQTSTFLMELLCAALHWQSLGVWNGSGPVITRFRGLHCSILKTRLTLCLNSQESTTLMLACLIPFDFPIFTRKNNNNSKSKLEATHYTNTDSNSCNMVMFKIEHNKPIHCFSVSFTMYDNRSPNQYPLTYSETTICAKKCSDICWGL